MSAVAPTCRPFLSVLAEPGWQTDFKDLPAIAAGELERHYEPTQAGSSCERQLRRGWNFAEERFIRNVEWLRVDNGVYARSTCVPSMKANYYRQLVMFNGDPLHVVHAFCSCTAGLSETCQHIAALLFAVAELLRPSCTDVKSAWVVPYKAPCGRPSSRGVPSLTGGHQPVPMLPSSLTSATHVRTAKSPQPPHHGALVRAGHQCRTYPPSCCAPPGNTNLESPDREAQGNQDTEEAAPQAGPKCRRRTCLGRAASKCRSWPDMVEVSAQFARCWWYC